MENQALKEYEQGRGDSHSNYSPKKDSDSYMFGYHEGEWEKKQFLKEIEEFVN